MNEETENIEEAEETYYVIMAKRSGLRKAADMLDCMHSQIVKLVDERDVKRIPPGVDVYNMNTSFEEVMLADFCRKRGHEILMFSITQQEWIIT
jgi:hypothetical protein